MANINVEASLPLHIDMDISRVVIPSRKILTLVDVLDANEGFMDYRN